MLYKDVKSHSKGCRRAQCEGEVREGGMAYVQQDEVMVGLEGLYHKNAEELELGSKGNM